ncbi:hypothetical protein CBR_g3216 [Chara braunii]|uniref:Uncharacterized protein n=1 Tax=Chara braunii TaxID=69332 RepID=A0A388KF36_CHABU|nr:hypothetical protein CBR_g3216 [Chara braunii]|eukprot:GBG68675.1 hypothetical protein CBR_g3216 [Chara braunii]
MITTAGEGSEVIVIEGGEGAKKCRSKVLEVATGGDCPGGNAVDFYDVALLPCRAKKQEMPTECGSSRPKGGVGVDCGE